jgi:hypothetical protein
LGSVDFVNRQLTVVVVVVLIDILSFNNRSHGGLWTCDIDVRGCL